MYITLTLFIFERINLLKTCSTETTKIISFVFKEYGLVTSGYCVHSNVSSGYHYDLSNCYLRKSGHSINDCKSDCTSLESCLGFEYTNKYSKPVCRLYPSSPSCPSDYTLYNDEEWEKMAETSADIVEYQSADSYHCYAKN